MTSLREPGHVDMLNSLIESAPELDTMRKKTASLYRTQRYAYWRVLDRHQLRVARSLIGHRNDLSVLEVGCASGKLLRAVAGPERARAVGLDINAFSLARARGASRTCADAEVGLPFASASFDLVLGMHILEHLRDPRAFLQEVRRICRPGGCVFLAYPAEPFRGAFALWSSLRLFHHPFAIRSIHRWRFNPPAVARLGEASGLIPAWSRYSARPLPQFFSVLKRPCDPRVRAGRGLALQKT
jgi:SAM-dependent methyltransferase